MKPYKFKLHIHYLSEPYKRVWVIQTQKHYYILTSVQIFVPMVTVFAGRDAKQPKAYLEGIGVVRIKGAKAIITES